MEKCRFERERVSYTNAGNSMSNHSPDVYIEQRKYIWCVADLLTSGVRQSDISLMKYLPNTVTGDWRSLLVLVIWRYNRRQQNRRNEYRTIRTFASWALHQLDFNIIIPKGLFSKNSVFKFHPPLITMFGFLPLHLCFRFTQYRFLLR